MPPTADLDLSTSLERYLRHVSIERGLSANTVAAYRRDLTVYLAELASRDVLTPSQVTAADVSTFARYLATRTESPLTASSGVCTRATQPQSRLRDT